MIAARRFPDFIFSCGYAYNFIKKETLAQVFSCEFCETFEVTILIEHLWEAASEYCQIFIRWLLLKIYKYSRTKSLAGA